MNATKTLAVTAVRCEARDVAVIELRDPRGGELPPFSPGAHLEIRLSDSIVRHYSLCNHPAERERYCIGVGLARDSGGGSKLIHDTVKVGTTLTVSEPRNNFPLDLTADEFVFVAGGIGITPIMSMILQCEAAGKRWRLYYCARNRYRMAFYEDLQHISQGRCIFHFDDEANGALFDASSVLGALPETTHVYCCGPGSLMSAVKDATSRHPQEKVHFEWFTAAEAQKSDDKPFRVRIRSTGARYDVPPGRTILEVLEDNGLSIPCSCREGLCATCKTGVLSGVPDHRDHVMSDGERARGDQMLICVSRAVSDELELDV